ncbi:hypothetical protein [Acidovorax sacchari]|uniref:hypothetical protein n=1 Tax=Acidovorax sacchari TaxID=3230736 RepID=UPI0039E2F567
MKTHVHFFEARSVRPAGFFVSYTKARAALAVAGFFAPGVPLQETGCARCNRKLGVLTRPSIQVSALRHSITYDLPAPALA